MSRLDFADESSSLSEWYLQLIDLLMKIQFPRDILLEELKRRDLCISTLGAEYLQSRFGGRREQLGEDDALA